MIKWEFITEGYVTPPGCYEEFISNLNHENIEKAVVQEHRFAFYYWVKWNNKLKTKLKTPPVLISIDYHQDLCWPFFDDMTEMEDLDQNSLSEVGMFSHARINPMNDTHILTAAYLDLIGDIYVLCKDRMHNDDEPFEDRYGKEHTVNVFYDEQKFSEAVLALGNVPMYFDIDLDYFTTSKECKLMKDKEIRKFINPEKDYFQHILKNMKGFTVATEPTHCGGLRNSLHLLNMLDKQFNPLLDPDE